MPPANEVQPDPAAGSPAGRLARELDLMAQQAGLRLRERYSGWNRQPFDSRSDSHVSVYRRD